MDEPVFLFFYPWKKGPNEQQQQQQQLVFSLGWVEVGLWPGERKRVGGGWMVVVDVGGFPSGCRGVRYGLGETLIGCFYCFCLSVVVTINLSLSLCVCLVCVPLVFVVTT